MYSANSPGLLSPPTSSLPLWLLGCWWRWCPTIPSEHLLLGGVGSYFWSSGTRVGGWAQVPLQCRRCSTFYAAQGMKRYVTDMAEGSCQALLSATLGYLSGLQSVNRSFRDIGSTAFKAESCRSPILFQRPLYQNPEHECSCWLSQNGSTVLAQGILRARTG